MNKLFMTLFTLFLGILIFIPTFTANSAEKDKKDNKPKCVYCEKYKQLKDWPQSERPLAYFYENIKYPEGMFKDMENKNRRSRQAKAGQMVYKRFVKGKSSLNKYQDLMIRDIAYFEALFNEMLNDPQAKVETLESLKKGREAMRMSLQISPKVKSSEAVLKFWAVGKMMKKARVKKKKKKKIDSEIAERVGVLAALKQQIALAKVNVQRAAIIEAQKEIDKLK